MFLQPTHLSLVPANMLDTLFAMGFCSKQVIVRCMAYNVQASALISRELPHYQLVSLVSQFLVSLKKN